MFCKNCGAKYEQGTNFCGTCGNRVDQASQSVQENARGIASTGSVTPVDQVIFAPTRPPQTESLAIVSLIMSILGVVFVLPVIGSILGIVLGIMSKRKIEESNGTLSGSGIAQGGIITGIVGLVLFTMGILLLIFVFLALGASAFSGMGHATSI